MKLFKIPLLLLILTLLSLIANGQSIVQVQGDVIDTAKTPIYGAKVTLIADKDTLVSNTNAEGKFFFIGIKHKLITVNVKSLGHTTTSQKFTLEEGEINQLLPTIIMKLSSTQLSEVVITSNVIPLRLMKDTIEFNALAYKIRQDDYVVDLLRQLPGVEVDKNDNVTTSGKPMNKIRVNGKDFFTGDVQEFISRLPANIVAKVQIIDDYGDNANFTGIKIGEPKKMLNLVLKDDIDQGTFGKIEASGGTNDRYNLNLDGNFWRGDKQIGLSSGSNNTSTKAGIDRSSDIRADFHDKFGEKLLFSGDYSYINNFNDLKQDNLIKTLTSFGTIENHQKNEEKKKDNAHNLNLRLQSQETNTYVSAILGGTLGSLTGEAITSSEQTGAILQNLNTNSTTHKRIPTFNGRLDIARKLNKPGRMISLSLAGGITNNNMLQYQNNRIGYLDQLTKLIVKDSINNQLIETRYLTNSINSIMTFTEPLNTSKISDAQTNLDFTYSISSITGNNDKITKFESPIGILKQIDSLSNENRTSSISQTFGLNVRHSNKTVNYTLGVNVQPINNFRNDNLIDITRRQVSIFPVAKMSFIPTPRTSIDFSYSGASILPSFDELQAIPNSTNLQNVIIGNPELKSAFNNNVNINYTNVTRNNLSTLRLSIDVNKVQNKVVSNTILIADTLNSLKQQTRFKNTNGNYGLGGNYFWSLSLANMKSQLEVKGDLRYSHEVFFVDNNESYGKSLDLTQSLTISTNLTWLRLNTSVNYLYMKNSYSLNTSQGNSIKSLLFNIDMKTYITKSLNAKLASSKSITKGYTVSDSNPFILDVSIEKSFFEDKRAQIAIRTNDLFNQGIILERYASGSTVSESKSNRISRYFMLTFIWKLQDFMQKDK